MQTRLPAFLALPLLMLLGGCPVWGHEDTAGRCRTAGDCVAGSYCDDGSGACLPSSTCTTDANCGANEHCDVSGSCVPDVTGGCRSNADCGPTDVCIEGFCRTVGAETCQFDLECDGNQRCVDNTCTFGCTTATDCGSGQKCSNGVCVADPTQCTTSADCGGGRHCVDGRCLQDCLGGGSCSNPKDVCSADDSFCRPDWQQNSFCTTNADCAAGSVCELGTGICRIACDAGSSLVSMYNANPNPSCTSATADCACQARNVLLPVCGLPSGADDYCRTLAETVSNCVTKADCATNQHCVDGSCQ